MSAASQLAKPSQPGLPMAAVIGGDSLIGAAYRQAAGRPLPWTSRRGSSTALAFDLERDDPRRLPWEAWRDAGCEHVLICAALTGIAACEQAPATSEALNLRQPLLLAEAARAAGLTPVLFSTDYVFGGRTLPYDESDPTSARNVYGRHKAALEAEALKAEPALVLRLSKVTTSTWGDGSLLAEMASRLWAGEPLRVARDQGLSPVALADLLSALSALMASGTSGLYQLAGSEAWTRSTLARALAAALDLPTDFIEEIALADLNEPFERPGLTWLSNRKLRARIPWSPTPSSKLFADLKAQMPPGSPPAVRYCPL